MAAFTNYIPKGTIVDFGNDQAEVCNVMKNNIYFIQMKTGTRKEQIFRVHRTEIKIAVPYISRAKDSFLKVHRILSAEFYYGNNLFHSSKYSLMFYPEHQIKQIYFQDILKNKIDEKN